MAVKGSQSKELITQKILSTFTGSFINEKEIRIPVIEDGVPIQIKVSLTCAKTNIDPNGNDILTPTTNEINFVDDKDTSSLEKVKPTENEKKNVADLLAALGL